MFGLRRTPSFFRRSALLAACVVIVSGCTDANPAPGVPSPAATQSVEPSSSSLRVAVDQPDNLLPHTADEPAELWIADALFDGLTRLNGHASVVPAGAVSWRPSADFQTWTFALRPGAVWHDGSPVTASDFVRGWRRVVRLGRMSHVLADVEGVDLGEDNATVPLEVRARDSLTLEVQLQVGRADFPAVAAHPALAPLPAGFDDQEFARRPIGNGPFQAAEELSTARFARLTRFESWRNGDRPQLDEIVFQTMDPETAYVAQQQGRIAIAPIPAGALRQSLTRLGDDVWRAPRAAHYLLGMNHARAPFDRVAVRRALSLAIDRVRLAGAVSEGNTLVTDGLIPPGFAEAITEFCTGCQSDPEAARVAFAAAGVSALTLSFNTGAGHEEVARRLRFDLAAVGVDLRLDPQEPEAFFDGLYGGDLALFRVGSQPDVALADAVLRPLLHSEAIPRGRSDRAGLRQNYGRYRSAEVDRLLDAARLTLAPAARAALQRRAARLALNTDQAVIPLFTYRHRLAVAPNVRNFAPDALGGVNWPAVRVVEAPIAPQRTSRTSG